MPGESSYSFLWRQAERVPRHKKKLDRDHQPPPMYGMGIRQARHKKVSSVCPM